LVVKASQTIADRVLFDLLHSASIEALNRDARPIATIAAKYMQYGSELREYDRTDRAVYWPLNAHAGRPARWPDLPLEQAPPAPSPAAPVAPEPAMATAEPLPQPAISPTPEPALRMDGRWSASGSSWAVRLTLAGGHFEGSAHCLLRNLRYRIEGRVGADGAIQGSVKAGRATFHPVSARVGGQWPSVILPSATHCRGEQVTLTPS
jgi:hypothetical protein